MSEVKKCEPRRKEALAGLVRCEYITKRLSVIAQNIIANIPGSTPLPILGSDENSVLLVWENDLFITLEEHIYHVYKVSPSTHYGDCEYGTGKSIDQKFYKMVSTKKKEK